MSNETDKCGICQSSRELQRDHDHSSGVTRGLVCRSCNRFIGLHERILSGKARKTPTRPYWKWLSSNIERIVAHMSNNTGETYRQKARPSPPPKNEFVEALSLHRKNQRMGLREAAAQIGTSPATLSRIERGHDYTVSTHTKLLIWMTAKDAR